MQIIGLGMDLVSTARIAGLLERHGPRFVERCFVESEQAYANAAETENVRTQRFAARFAAKEAVMKALSAGWDSVSWTDIEVTRSAVGQPGVQLYGAGAEFAARLGVHSWLLTLTHTDEAASAAAIAMGQQ